MNLIIGHTGVTEKYRYGQEKRLQDPGVGKKKDEADKCEKQCRNADLIKKRYQIAEDEQPVGEFGNQHQIGKRGRYNPFFYNNEVRYQSRQSNPKDDDHQIGIGITCDIQRLDDKQGQNRQTVSNRGN